jgi:hypothetical protein
MQSLSALSAQELTWTQPNASRMEYELRADDTIAATLRFRSMFGSFATAESADGCWTFKRVGFWTTRITIRPCGSDQDIASFVNNTWSGGGTLTLPDGRKLLASTNMWMSQYEFKNENDASLLRFELSGLIHLSAAVEIQPAGQSLPELPWLVPFGWYLAILMYLDTSAASTGVVVT